MKRRIAIITLIFALFISTSVSANAATEEAIFSAPAKYEIKSIDDSVHWIDGYSVEVLEETSFGGKEFYFTIDTNYQLTLSGNETEYINFELYEKNEGEDSKLEDDEFVIVETEGTGIFSRQLGIKLDKEALAKAKPGTYIGYLNLKQGSNCVLEGTDIMLADGSTKKVEDVQVGDVIKTYDFFTGEISSRPVLYNLPEKNKTANVIHVSFDNGETLDICDCQSFFDMDKLDYFDVDATTAKSSIGKNIMYIDGNEVKTAKISNVTSENKVCNSYEIFTEYDMNFVANGVLTIEPGVWYEGLYSIGADLKIDQEQYQADVAKYGQYEYKVFEKYISEATFEKLRAADCKIAVGKGLIDEEEFFAECEKWIPLKKAANQADKTMLKSTMLTSSPTLNAEAYDFTTEIVLVIPDNSGKKPVDTSDSNNMEPYVWVTLIALAGITVVGYKRKEN